MLIHKTHSKKDLCNIIRTFNISIDDPEKLKKKELIRTLVYKFKYIDEIEPDLDFYMIYNLVDLNT